jgi:hypothetical protein
VAEWHGTHAPSTSGCPRFVRPRLATPCARGACLPGSWRIAATGADGVEALITQRSQVQILPPQPRFLRAGRKLPALLFEAGRLPDLVGGAPAVDCKVRLHAQRPPADFPPGPGSYFSSVRTICVSGWPPMLVSTSFLTKPTPGANQRACRAVNALPSASIVKS